MLKQIFPCFIAIIITGCSAPRLPENAVVTPSDSLGRRFMTSSTFQIQTSSPEEITFRKAKLCIAQHIQNEGVSLDDSSGSFVGPYTGHYYQINNSRTTQSGQALVMADDELKTVIARGVVPFDGADFFKLKHYLKFAMKTSIKANNINIEFTQLSAAQADTGYMSNNGFGPVGAWGGGPAGGAYKATETVANTIFACINE